MIAAYLAKRRQRAAQARLEATRKPDPQYIRRRMAQLSPERRARWVMNAGVFSPELFQ